MKTLFSSYKEFFSPSFYCKLFISIRNNFFLFLSLPFCARIASFFIFISHFHFKYPFAYLFYVIYIFLFSFFSYYIFLRLFTNHRKKYGWMGVNSGAWFSFWTLLKFNFFHVFLSQTVSLCPRGPCNQSLIQCPILGKFSSRP